MPPNIRRCDHPECGEEGKFPAPQSRQKLREYYWFCLDHVRDYNRKWDYYAGMKPEEIELELISGHHMESSQLGFWYGPRAMPNMLRVIIMPPSKAMRKHRRIKPAQKMARQILRMVMQVTVNQQGETAQMAHRVPDFPIPLIYSAMPMAMEITSAASKNARGQRASVRHSGRKPPFEVEVKRALGFFDLVPPFSEADLKTRFKQLVKIHHPDANLGDKAAEERLKQVIADYHFLRQLYHPPT